MRDAFYRHLFYHSLSEFSRHDFKIVRITVGYIKDRGETMKTVLFLSHDVQYAAAIEKGMDISRYQLVLADNIPQMHAIVETEDIDVIIYDFYEEIAMQSFLERVKADYPKIIRIRLCDTSKSHDTDKIQLARMKCTKTIGVSGLWGTIDKVLEIDEKVKNKALTNLMSTLKHLPTIPEMYHELTEMVRRNASVEDIATRLEEDPSITSNILKMANTAFYNAKTGSIRQAIMYIGLNNVKNIILSTAVFGNDGLSPKAREIHWEHVRMTNKILNAFYVEVLGKKLDVNISSIGLLHDIGSVILMANFPVIFDDIVKRVNQDPSESFQELETQLIGFNHELLGGYLLDLWGLPYPMIEAALMHHEPMSTSIINRELVMSVHLANYYAWRALPYEKYDNDLCIEVFHELGITQREFDIFFEKLQKK